MAEMTCGVDGMAYRCDIFGGKRSGSEKRGISPVMEGRNALPTLKLGSRRKWRCAAGTAESAMLAE